MATNSRQKDLLQELLNNADIVLNGNRPFDIQVLDERFYSRVLTGGSLAFGESYMDGWWECQKIDELVSRIFKAELHKKIPFTLSSIRTIIEAFLMNGGSKKSAFNIGEKHYDIGNDVFEAMLDKRLVYTCAYWEKAENLNDAQEAKLDLVCRKIGLKKGDRILDIGCGWGSFAKFAAEKYGASVVGVTVSKEQAELARELCVGLPVEIRLQDYRDVDEKFDHIVSLGMFEHVGGKYYKTYMEVANKCLKNDGLFLLHTIGSNQSNGSYDSWLNKYIFPGAKVPGISEIGKSIDNLFVMEDWHNFGPYYAKTLHAWFQNFDSNWSKLESKYGKRFYRMWKYYLLACAGSFEAREIELWQIVLSKKGLHGGYKSHR